ncbi:MAG: hypothetical protein K0S27_47 [Gammaproteobacteria bacterium]|jgi:hypothetical protein|nr:hypothetical protein [Gammaproteobacteria bacterium]
MYGVKSPSSSFVYWVAAFFSLLLSIWIASQETVINPDAICYLQSAAIIKQGIHAAMNLCPQAKWPFYSLLIAGVVSITKLSYVVAAYAVDSIFSLITVLAFIAIVAFIAGEKKAYSSIRWVAAFVILLAHEFNAVKAYIIRDHGFWGFYLLSILFLLYYFHEPRWRYALAWSISLLVATLFRIEGAIFLLAIPFITFFESKKNIIIRCKVFFQLNSMTWLVGLAMSAWFLFHPSYSSGRLSELQFQLLHGMMFFEQNFQLKTAGFMNVLGNNGARDASLVLILTLLAWYVLSVIANLSWIYSALFIYSGWKKLLVTTPATRWILWSYILINVAVTALFLGQNMFLSKRYLIALSLVLMLWVPFALIYLMQRWRQKKWPLIVVLLCIVFSSLGGIFNFGYSKRYVQEAGRWLAVNVPQHAVVYSNDLQVMYYSCHFGNQIFDKAQAFSTLETIAHGRWKKYDYLALRIDQKELSSASGVLQEINLTPIQIFHNKRGDQVRIYRGHS